jgi:hypothetical protein
MLLNYFTTNQVIKLQDFNDERANRNMEVAVLVYSKIGPTAASFLGKIEDNNEQNSQFYSSESLTYTLFKITPWVMNGEGLHCSTLHSVRLRLRYVRAQCAAL